MITKNYLSKILSDFKAYNSSPFVIEILGTPNSGKTTSIKRLDTILKRCNVNYKIIYEVAHKCKIDNKFSPEFNLWTLHETSKLLLEALNSPKKYDIIICERGYFDLICWLNLYHKDNKLNKNDFDIIKNFLLLNRYAGSINLVYALKCNINVALEREHLETFFNIPGRIVNENVLKKYNTSLDEIFEIYVPESKRVILDTSEIPQKDLYEIFVDIILNKLQSYSAVQDNKD